jgi:hypothetical protein
LHLPCSGRCRRVQLALVEPMGVEFAVKFKDLAEMRDNSEPESLIDFPKEFGLLSRIRRGTSSVEHVRQEAHRLARLLLGIEVVFLDHMIVIVEQTEDPPAAVVPHHAALPNSPNAS